MGLHDQKIEGVPQFVSCFTLVVEIMRDIGGQARPRQIFDELIKRHEIPDSFLSLTNKNGGSKFENRVHFARSYLFKAGAMTSPSCGVWGLKELGWKANLTLEWAAEILRTARINFSGDEDEQEAPKDDILSDGNNHWFVGASWADGDQTDRFLEEGVWQNGYEDKFSKLVRQMKPGDRVAIKPRRDPTRSDRQPPLLGVRGLPYGGRTAHDLRRSLPCLPGPARRKAHGQLFP